MDLSFLKWPLIILVVGSFGFLLSTPGLNYMYERALNDAPGQDAEIDAANEATISRLAGVMLGTFRYSRAASMYETAVKRFPDGMNNWYNWYQLARCYEKLEKYPEAVDILVMLRDENADRFDERVESPTQLDARIQKLIELHELQPRPWVRAESAL